MDDYLESSSTIGEAAKKAKALVKLLERGRSRLTKFVSNVPEIPNDLEPTCKPSSTAVKIIPKTGDSSHVLGMKWNHLSDSLVVSRGTSTDINRTLAQKIILSLVPAVYDPIGLVAPYTVSARILLKDIRRLHGQQWDDNLPGETVTKFNEWSEDLAKLSQIEIPRSYFEGPFTALELHMFGDSLQDIFTPVAFLQAKVTTQHTWKPYRISLRLRKSQSGSNESCYRSKTRVASFITCLAPPERYPKRTYSPNLKNFYVDGQHNRPSMASFSRKTTCFHCQQCGRDFRSDNSRRMELCPNVRQPRGCRYKWTTSQRPLRQPLNTDFPFQTSNEIQLRLKGNKADAKTSDQVDIETTAMAAVTTTIVNEDNLFSKFKNCTNYFSHVRLASNSSQVV